MIDIFLPYGMRERKLRTEQDSEVGVKTARPRVAGHCDISALQGVG
jgi:hypothetical protein